MKTAMNPHNVTLVARHNGKEVGRKPATDPHATEWLDSLARQYKELNVEYLEDEQETSDQRLIASLFR